MGKKERKKLARKKAREEKDKAAAAAKRKKAAKRAITYSIALIVVVGIVWAFISASKPDPRLTAIAQCLTENDAVMYGTDWCQYCQQQKASFGPAFQYVTYVNCDFNKLACEEAGVQGYPTWEFSDGSTISGVQQIEHLAQRAECQA